MSIVKRIQQHKTKVLLGITFIAIIAICFVSPIPQDPSYHLFADNRNIFTINYFWNVVSNVPFLVFGIYGLKRSAYLIEAKSYHAYIALCIGVLLVGLGSAYYHYAPSTATLLWDRLPMTIAFMALFSMLLDERVMPPTKDSLTLSPLLIIGIFSVIYWYWTETVGRGDLRLYVLVQFLPLILIPLILWLFESSYLQGRLLINALIWYLLAKVCEYFDKQILELLGFFSGHTIKHLLASMATLSIIQAVPTQKNQAIQ